MKIIFVVLIFCFSINSISSFSWFGFRSNQQVKQITDLSTTTHRSTFQSRRYTFQQQNYIHNITNSRRPGIIPSNKNNTSYLSRQNINNQRRYQFRNTTAINRQADSINKNSSQLVPRNRFQAIVYQQQQYRSLNNQSNRVMNKTNNQRVNPRFHSFFLGNKTNRTVINPNTRRGFSQAPFTKFILADSKRNNSSNIKTNIQQLQLRSASAQASLDQILTTKINNNKVSPDRRRLLDNFYNQQRLKAFYQRLNEQTASRTHSNMKTALRKRKRQNEQQNNSLDGIYSMINVRSETENDFD